MKNKPNDILPASFKASPVKFNQSLLFPSNIFDLLVKDHECYLYKDLFDQLDTGTVESQYSHNGQHAYPPKLLISILIYAYSRGVFSLRQIERRGNEGLSFMFIAQMNCRTREKRAVKFPWTNRSANWSRRTLSTTRQTTVSAVLAANHWS